MRLIKRIVTYPIFFLAAITVGLYWVARGPDGVSAFRTMEGGWLDKILLWCTK
jgi:hypothetical protein